MHTGNRFYLAALLFSVLACGKDGGTYTLSVTAPSRPRISGAPDWLTISECGNIPSPEADFAAGVPFSWFMVWNTTFENGAIDIQGFPLNTTDYWKSLMNSDLVYNRENMPSIK